MADNDRALVAQLRRIATWDVFAGLPADVRTPNRAADAFEAALDREERLERYGYETAGKLADEILQRERLLGAVPCQWCVRTRGSRLHFNAPGFDPELHGVHEYEAPDWLAAALAGPGQKGDSDAQAG